MHCWGILGPNWSFVAYGPGYLFLIAKAPHIMASLTRPWTSVYPLWPLSGAHENLWIPACRGGHGGGGGAKHCLRLLYLAVSFTAASPCVWAICGLLLEVWVQSLVSLEKDSIAASLPCDLRLPYTFSTSVVSPPLPPRFSQWKRKDKCIWFAVNSFLSHHHWD